jgi:peroxiredoxin (alkyl hydroperoxide reductase subunit C)
LEETTTAPALPQLGKPVPEFTAVTTQGEVNFPADYKGHWVVFFSHPADFTPVCTSEFMTFAHLERDFAAINTKLLGLSIDSLYGHIAWLRTIKEKMEYRGWKDVEVQFPLIEDISMNIARQYGMIQAGEATTQAMRAVFIVDPNGILRTMLYYPLAAGRNMQEILRVIKALQVADAFDVATPADWVPGERVIVPTAGSCGQAKERMEGDMDGVECVDWFFCTKEISKADIDAALATDPDVVLGRGVSA